MILARLIWTVLWKACPLAPPPTRPTTFPVVEDIVARLGCQGVKRALDEAVDACAAMQNVREGVLRLMRTSETEGSPSKRDHAARRARNYIERYVYLLLFAVYLHEVGPRERGHPPVQLGLTKSVSSPAVTHLGKIKPFRLWMSSLPNVRIYEMLDNIRM